MGEIFTTRWLVYKTIKENIALYGYAPSLRDIAFQVGVHSPATVLHHVEKLEEAGYLKRLGKPSRAIVLGELDWTQ